MTQYLDMTQTAGCVAIIPENGETVVLTGVSVYSMPLSVKRKESEILFVKIVEKSVSSQRFAGS